MNKNPLLKPSGAKWKEGEQRVHRQIINKKRLLLIYHTMTIISVLQVFDILCLKICKCFDAVVFLRTVALHHLDGHVIRVPAGVHLHTVFKKKSIPKLDLLACICCQVRELQPL